ncbi:AEC family transporter [Asticcacaulis sp. BYS171W]|uniref:AEC family transporter n=1 Tax=Asticcacaulis aquaticus TaxID=2984212 RepID=A0ABT5HXY8_9CAUL|nr:AEC family transporter [Asticcacaulis aquaticus]MDC7684888.1 AEC family transporter [Asticcacaulis aquaticus]
MFDTLSRVLLFFSFVALGALLVRTRRLKAEGLDGLSAYFYWLGFPAYLIHAFAQLPRPDAAMSGWLALYAGAFVLSSGLCLLAARSFKATRGEATGAGMAAFISNSAFLGMPIAAGLFGPDVLKVAPLLFVADFLILFFIGCAGLSLASGHGIGLALKRTMQNPTVLGSLFGVGLMLAGIKLPPMVDQAFDILGRSSVPVALVALGGMLGLMPLKQLSGLTPVTIIAVAGKLLLAPALMAVVMHVAGVPPLMFRVAVFLAACPTAVSVFIQARMYGLWYEGAAVSIAQSTVISLFTLSGLALVLTHL